MLNPDFGPGALGLEKHEFPHLECLDMEIWTKLISSILALMRSSLAVFSDLGFSVVFIKELSTKILFSVSAIPGVHWMKTVVYCCLQSMNTRPYVYGACIVCINTFMDEPFGKKHGNVSWT